MRSNFTPFTRLSAGGLMLAAAAADIGCAAAEPRRSHARHAAGATQIEELGALSGKGYDDIIVTLAPLVAAKSGKEAHPAERTAVPAPAAEAPKIAAPAESAKPAPAVPVFLREPLPTFETAPVSAAAPERAVVATPAEPAAAAAPLADSAPQAAAPTAEIASSAEPGALAVATVATTAEPPAAAEPQGEQVAAPEAKAEGPKSEAPAVEAAPAPSAGAAPPAEEQSDSPLALWQALVAAVALGGLLAMKYLRRGPAAAKAAEPSAPKAAAPQQSEAAPASRSAIALAAMRTKFAPLLAKFAALRGKKAVEAAPKAEAAPKEAPKKPKAMDWTEVATALRARFGGGKTVGAATGEPAAAQSDRVIALVDSEGRGRAADSWDTSEDDGLELLEPGDASARTIVMNARRRLRSAQS